MAVHQTDKNNLYLHLIYVLESHLSIYFKVNNTVGIFSRCYVFKNWIPLPIWTGLIGPSQNCPLNQLDIWYKSNSLLTL